MKKLLLLNEEGTPGYATTNDVVGMGDVIPPTKDTLGSGDKFVELGNAEVKKKKKKESDDKEYMKDRILSYEQFIKMQLKNQNV